MYISVSDLQNYRIGFDFSEYSEIELSAMLEVAQGLITDFIGYEINSDNVDEEEGEAVFQKDGKLFISLKNRGIEDITDLKIYFSEEGFQNIALDNIELHRKSGFLYIPMNGYYNLNYSFLYKQNRVPYKVSYQITPREVPAGVKLAMAKITGNLFRADINASSGAVGEDGKVKSFVSGDYSVKFGGSELSYKGKYNTGSAPENPFVDDSVKILLNKLKRVRQNTY